MRADDSSKKVLYRVHPHQQHQVCYILSSSNEGRPILMSNLCTWLFSDENLSKQDYQLLHFLFWQINCHADFEQNDRTARQGLREFIVHHKEILSNNQVMESVECMFWVNRYWYGKKVGVDSPWQVYYNSVVPKNETTQAYVPREWQVYYNSIVTKKWTTQAYVPREGEDLFYGYYHAQAYLWAEFFFNLTLLAKWSNENDILNEAYIDIDELFVTGGGTPENVDRRIYIEKMERTWKHYFASDIKSF